MLGMPPLTANAYLGGLGIAAASTRAPTSSSPGGSPTPRSSLGPAAWRFGWARDDWDPLAGAVVAGHIIECGAQATGGNYAFFERGARPRARRLPDRRDAADGSFVITKHAGHRRAGHVGTVTAQLLYEIDGPRYLNPDVTRASTPSSSPRRARTGSRSPGVAAASHRRRHKVAVNDLGGFRNTMTFVLTGLDIDAKAELVERRSGRGPGRARAFDEVDVRLRRSDPPIRGPTRRRSPSCASR